MHVFYRITNPPPYELKPASKWACLKNFIEVCPKFTIFADNMTVESLDELRKHTTNWIELISCGNSGSFKHALDRALEGSDEMVYFVEDDYFHLPNPIGHLTEALNHSDYATLYDHPDKYQVEYQYGETTKVIKTKSSHWKYTCSTTMTFASTKYALKRDYDIWQKHLNDPYPHDHLAFLEIGPARLLSSIPGRACHMDMTYSWTKVHCLLDDWALAMLGSTMQRPDTEHHTLDHTNQA